MRIAFALAAFLAFAPNAIAKESGDKQFSYNGELRVRYQMDDNMSGSTSVAPNNNNTVQQRLKLGGTYKASEKFSASATFLNSMNWGSPDLFVNAADGSPAPWSAGDGPGQRNGAHANNLVMVQEAYGTWMMSDDTTIKFGRGAFTMADGTVIAANDYEPTPYAFDGALVNYEFDLGRLSAWAVKFAEYSGGTQDNVNTLTGATGTTSGNYASDPEANGYGLSFDLKRMPEWLKLFNAHVILNQKAATPNAASLFGFAADPVARMGQESVRYGFALGGAFGRFDLKANFEGTSGKYKCKGGLDTANPANHCDDENAQVEIYNNDGMMYQAELGMNFEEFMKSRVWVKYHWDSGNKKATTDADKSKIETYDPYYYDQYSGSGLMQVLKWGNLTYINAGVSAKPSDQTTVQLQYWIFSKSEKAGQMNPGRYGYMAALTSPDSTDLGQEIDLSAEHRYDGGFSILTRVGYFMQGTAIKDGLIKFGQSTEKSDDAYTQFMVQAKMVF